MPQPHTPVHHMASRGRGKEQQQYNTKLLEYQLITIQYKIISISANNNNNTKLLAYQQNTMPLAIYNTKQYDIHQVGRLIKTTSTASCRDKCDHSIRYQYIHSKNW